MTGDSPQLHRVVIREATQWLAAAALVAVSVTVTAGLSAPNAAAATPRQVGVAPNVPRGAVRTGAPDGGTQLRLDVELAPRDPAGLATFVNAVSDPKSVQYKHYLAKGQFAPVFGPSQATIDSVTGALRAEGLSAGAPSPDGLTIPVTTTFAKASAAFGTAFTNYHLRDGRTAFANDTAPSLPGSVVGAVQGIVGLDSLVQAKPEYSAPHAKPTTSHGVGSNRPAVKSNSATPQMCGAPSDYWAQQTPPLFDTTGYWESGSLSQPQAYNTAPLYNKYGDTGQNVTVGLFELENYDSTDLVNYEQCFGLNVPVYNVTVDGGPAKAPDPLNGVGLESNLDMDVVAGMAPGATVLVYQGPDHTSASPNNVLDVYQRMETDDSAQVLSTSWGQCSDGLSPAFIAAEGNVFAAAAAQGQSVLSASGDEGSTDCYGEGMAARTPR